MSEGSDNGEAAGPKDSARNAFNDASDVDTETREGTPDRGRLKTISEVNVHDDNSDPDSHAPHNEERPASGKIRIKIGGLDKWRSSDRAGLERDAGKGFVTEDKVESGSRENNKDTTLSRRFPLGATDDLNLKTREGTKKTHNRIQSHDFDEELRPGLHHDGSKQARSREAGSRVETTPQNERGRKSMDVDTKGGSLTFSRKSLNDKRRESPVAKGVESGDYDEDDRSIRVALCKGKSDTKSDEHGSVGNSSMRKLHSDASERAVKREKETPASARDSGGDESEIHTSHVVSEGAPLLETALNSFEQSERPEKGLADSRIGDASILGASARDRKDTHDNLPYPTDAGSRLSPGLTPPVRTTGSGGEVGAETIGIKEPSGATATTTSFLDALGEEERRVRTRHIPNVDGFRMLHRNEIKRDLQAAKMLLRKMNTSQPNSEKGGRSRRGSSCENDGQDKKRTEALPSDRGGEDDDDDGVPPSDDETTSEESGRLRNSQSRNALVDNLPASRGAFTLPESRLAAESREAEIGRDISMTAGQNEAPTIPNGKPPQHVASLTSFNPPRPPESAGPKKKHRLLRWERNPDEVEVDLETYRKTVQKTREELHTVELEQQKVEMIGDHLRTHYMEYLKLMREESTLLNEELGITLRECAKKADLVSSRTRNRGGGKGSILMKDVIAVLRSRHHRLGDRTENGEAEKKDGERQIYAAGIGGIMTGKRRDSASHDSHISVANGWLLAGDFVQTQFGEGRVLKVHGPCMLEDSGNSASKPPSGGVTHLSEGSNEDPDPQTSASLEAVASEAEPTQGKRARLDVESRIPATKRQKISSPTASVPILPGRVSVRLPFGVLYARVDEVIPLENVAAYSDDQLAVRWNQMIKTSRAVYTCLDLDAMTKTRSARIMSEDNGDPAPVEDRVDDDGHETDRQNRESADHNEHTDMDIDSNQAETSRSRRDEPDLQNDMRPEHDGQVGSGDMELSLFDNGRVLPFGSGVLPSSGLWGGGLAEVPLRVLKKALVEPLLYGNGVDGKLSNITLPAAVTKWENQRNEVNSLKGKVLQLRNALYRQRRIRVLNQRSYAAAHERAEKVEGLLVEMKADLKSLKERLLDELVELGIDMEMAEDMLATYFVEHCEHEHMEVEENFAAASG